MASAVASATTPRIVAVVTGANKGIGFEIARVLGKMSHLHVIATSRNCERGEMACEELRRHGTF